MGFSAFDVLTPDKQRELMTYAETSNGKAVDQKPTPEPLFVSMDTIAPETVDWLWPNRIPIGRITLLDGDPGAGKSFLCLAVATAVSLGAALPGGPKFRTPSNVLLLSIEDGFADTVRPRLDSMGADVAKIFIPNPKRGLAPSLLNAAYIETTVKQIGPLLVVIDPIVAFSTKTNKNRDHEVRELLNPLMTIAEKHSLACIIVRHFTKNESVKAMYRGGGSVDFMAACRSAFVVAEDGQQDGRRILAHVKNSLGPKQPSLSFFIDDGRFQWGEVVDTDADQLLQGPQQQGRERQQLDGGKRFLEEVLSHGPQTSNKVKAKAKKAGISNATLWRAKELMDIKASKERGSGEWWWRLSRDDDERDERHEREEEYIYYLFTYPFLLISLIYLILSIYPNLLRWSDVKLLKPEEVSRILGVSRSTAQRMMHEGQVPCIRLRCGKRKAVLRVNEESLMKWLTRKETQGQRQANPAA